VHAACPTHFIIFDLLILITCGKRCTLWSSLLSCFLQLPNHFIPLWSKHSLHHSDLGHPQHTDTSPKEWAYNISIYSSFRTTDETEVSTTVNVHVVVYAVVKEGNDVPQPSLWSGGQSSWLQIQRSRFDSRRYQIFWKVVGLERGPISIVSKIEVLLRRKSSDSSLEIRDYDHRDPPRRPRCTLYTQKLALTLSTSGGRSVSVVHSQTKVMELLTFLWIGGTHLQVYVLSQCGRLQSD
jgi:hypothetical protein